MNQGRILTFLYTHSTHNDYYCPIYSTITLLQTELKIFENSAMNQGNREAGEPSEDANHADGMLLRLISNGQFEPLERFKDIEISQLSEVDNEGLNPLHVLAQYRHISETKIIEIVKILVEAYLKERRKEEKKTPPWLMKDGLRRTPLTLAILYKKKRLALHLFSLDKDEFLKDKEGNDILFHAIRYRSHKLIINDILDVLEGSRKEEYRHLLRNRDGLTLLYYAPYCNARTFGRVLRMSDPQLPNGGSYPRGLLSEWIRVGEYYPFKYVMVDCYEKGLHLDLRMEWINQFSEPNTDGQTPLHVLTGRFMSESKFLIVKVLTEAYNIEENKKEAAERKTPPPWLIKDRDKNTPLRLAMTRGNEKVASYLFSLDKLQFLENEKYILFEAIDNSLYELAESILEEISNHKEDLIHLLTNKNGWNALHYAPNCSEKYLSILLKDIQFREWTSGEDGFEISVVRKWLEMDTLWPFEYIAKLSNIELFPEQSSIWSWTTQWVRDRDESNQGTLEWAAENGNDGTNIVKIMEILYKIAGRDISAADSCFYIWYPFFIREYGSNGYSCMSIAISRRNQQLALFFLSKLPDDWAKREIADKEMIFEALENNCIKVVEYLLKWGLRMESILKRSDESNNENILHFGSECSETSEQIISDIIEKYPHFVNAKDRDDLSPLDKAAKAGTTWLVKLLLKKDRLSIQKSPDAWIEACNQSDVSTILAFIDDSPYLRALCRSKNDTPLHHVKNLTYTEYEELLKRPLMLEFKNNINDDGKTPLHVAIENGDMHLAEILLTMTDVDRTIKDKNGKTAMDLLKQVCDGSEEWTLMCKANEVDTASTLAYIQPNTNLSEMRTTISLVAALLATITFTAGFTLPGGLNDKSHQANLANKWLFITFLIVDSCAMCCSMLVLFCIVWSMIGKRDESKRFIDRSLVLLKFALYGTLIAFATGVFLVIYQKSLWVAIFVSVICALVIFLAGRTYLGYALKLIPATNDEQWWRFWNKKYYLLPMFDKTPPTPTAATTTSSPPAATTSTPPPTAATTSSTRPTAATATSSTRLTASSPPTAP